MPTSFRTTLPTTSMPTSFPTPLPPTREPTPSPTLSPTQDPVESSIPLPTTDVPTTGNTHNPSVMMILTNTEDFGNDNTNNYDDDRESKVPILIPVLSGTACSALLNIGAAILWRRKIKKDYGEENKATKKGGDADIM